MILEDADFLQFVYSLRVVCSNIVNSVNALRVGKYVEKKTLVYRYAKSYLLTTSNIMLRVAYLHKLIY